MDASLDLLRGWISRVEQAAEEAVEKNLDYPHNPWGLAEPTIPNNSALLRDDDENVSSNLFSRALRLDTHEEEEEETPHRTSPRRRRRAPEINENNTRHTKKERPPGRVADPSRAWMLPAEAACEHLCSYPRSAHRQPQTTRPPVVDDDAQRRRRRLCPKKRADSDSGKKKKNEPGDALRVDARRRQAIDANPAPTEGGDTVVEHKVVIDAPTTPRPRKAGPPKPSPPPERPRVARLGRLRSIVRAWRGATTSAARDAETFGRRRATRRLGLVVLREWRKAASISAMAAAERSYDAAALVDKRARRQLGVLFKSWRSWAASSALWRRETIERARRLRFASLGGRAFGTWARRAANFKRTKRRLQAARARRTLRRVFGAWHDRVMRSVKEERAADAEARRRRLERAWIEWRRVARRLEDEREAARALEDERRREAVATRWHVRRVRSLIVIHWRRAAAALREERAARERDAERRREVLALQNRVAAGEEQRVASKSEKPPPPPPPSLDAKNAAGAQKATARAFARRATDAMDARARERRARRKVLARKTEERLEQRRAAQKAARALKEDEGANEFRAHRARIAAKEAAAEAERALARHQLAVARLHYERACVRWRGTVPWQACVRSSRILRAKAVRWYADGLLQRAWASWIEWREERRTRVVAARREGVVRAARLADRARCRVPLARWVSAARDVVVRGVAVATRHRRIVAARRLEVWRKGMAREAAKTAANWERAVALDERLMMRRVVRDWLKKLRLWRQQAHLQARADAKWGKVRRWIGEA